MDGLVQFDAMKGDDNHSIPSFDSGTRLIDQYETLTDIYDSDKDWN